MSDTSKYLKIGAAVILPNVGGWVNSVITRSNLKPWYASLNKPKWNPPNYVFGPVWTSIYAAIGYSSYLVFEELVASGNGFDKRAQVALALYANQMALNWAWTPIFFKYHSLKWVSNGKIDVPMCVCVYECALMRVHRKKMSGIKCSRLTYHTDGL